MEINPIFYHTQQGNYIKQPVSEYWRTPPDKSFCNFLAVLRPTRSLQSIHPKQPTICCLWQNRSAYASGFREATKTNQCLIQSVSPADDKSVHLSIPACQKHRQQLPWSARFDQSIHDCHRSYAESSANRFLSEAEHLSIECNQNQAHNNHLPSVPT